MRFLFYTLAPPKAGRLRFSASLTAHLSEY